jgi:ABC-2 type transport system ATP-binding protein
LSHEGVVDAVIQGSSVRVVVSAGHEQSMQGNGYEAVAPRLEDAYVELLGGAQKGESLLARGWPTSDASGEVLVSCRGLTKRFGTFVAADRVNFEVHAGEIYGLLGPNGAGKSTTFRMLCGLLKPTEGDASVAGVNLLHAPGRARARLGYMAQKFSLYGALSVAQNLDYFAGIYGLKRAQKRERIQAMIDSFSLGPHLQSNAALLPLGFKQRLALACATLHAPAVLFLDEPTSGVDPLMRREFWHHINALTGRGVALVVTTHFMEEAEYCDRIGVIWSGRKIAEGSPDELKASIATASHPEPTLEETFITLLEREAA